MFFDEFRLLSLEPSRYEYRRVGRSSGATAIAVVSPFTGRQPRRSEARHFAPLAAIGRIPAALRLWGGRGRSRQQLPVLSDYLLKDIGLRREDVGYEYSSQKTLRNLTENDTRPDARPDALFLLLSRREITMDTIERLYGPITKRASWDTAIGALGYKDSAVTLRAATADSSLSWAIHLLPAQRRRALRALYAFCREVDDVADGEASHALKETLLGNWRGEIAHLYGGRPRNAVTLGLSKAVHLYGLRCHDFLAIIDGAEMKAQTDIRAPTFAQLDHYCERVAVAVGRLSVRIFGEETLAGERVAAELGRASQLTNILCDLAEDAKRHRLYLPRELLHARGIFATTPSWVLAHPALPNVCRDLAVVAERHYAAAAEAIAACSRWTMRPTAVMLGIHRALLHELLVRGWRHIDKPVRIPARHKLALVIRHGLTGR
jgi:presqualene diphosphate synthase